jgi:GPH family glycoside/pentoside/hexuronide:cation symporter
MTAGILGRAGLAAYAAFAMPLAMAVLPVYVHVPKLYADELGLPLATVGLVLLLARLVDAVQDPLIGWWIDRRAAAGTSRQGFIAVAVVLLGCGVLALFHPPRIGSVALTVWLCGALAVTYLGFSLGAIAYFAQGAELSPDYHERTRVTAARGAVGVLGVLVAAALPELLTQGGSHAEGLARFSLVFIPVLLTGAGITLFFAPKPAGGASGATLLPLSSILAPLANPAFRWLLAVFMVSGIAAAIPATLILFFVQDVLDRSDMNAVFLGIYFLFGALGMPLWVRASRAFGKKRVWAAGMGASVVAFAWAFLLGPGDGIAFAMVCALSGIAYGSQLALPPSLLADVIDRDQSGCAEGAYFGFWQFTEKMELALAAGVALPVLGLIGYRPGTAQPPMGDLSAMYALVPCLLQLAAAVLLWLAPIDRELSVRPPAGAAP